MQTYANPEEETLELTRGLNSSQKEAVLNTNGRLLVLAGAGAGKTKVLTTRVAHLLQQGVDPWRIMAITFTNKSANEMRNRAIDMDRSAARSWIGTFHRICGRILSANLQHLGLTSYTIMTDGDQKELIKRAVKTMNIEADKKRIYSILSQISTWKSNNIAPGQAQSQSHGQQALSEVARLYERYEDAKTASHYFDYDDLLLKIVQLFRNHPEVLGYYQNMFQYVMIDEFQDTNKIQFDIIDMLTKKHGNVFLVGDPDQSIYRFRSALIENILNYQNLYPDTKIIRLQENYRSTQKIVDASNALIRHNHKRLERDAFSVGKPGDDIHVFQFNDASREADFVARMMANVRKETGSSWSDFAVLYRMNFQAKHLELALRDENIPYKIVGTTSFYDRKEIHDLTSYLRVISNLWDDLALERTINVPKRSIGGATLDKIRFFAEERKIPMFTALQHIDEIAEQTNIRKGTVKNIKEYAELIKELKSDALTGEFSAANFLKTVIRKSKFMNQFDREKEEDEARIENIAHLRDFAVHWDSKDQDINNLAQFVSEITLDGDADEEHEDFVTLTSVHSAKGLEWPETFVIGMEDNVFPHIRSKGSEDDLEEERRLLYVAMTRAANRLYLSYSSFRFDHGSQRPVKQKPSPFLMEIPDIYKTTITQTA